MLLVNSAVSSTGSYGNASWAWADESERFCSNSQSLDMIKGSYKLYEQVCEQAALTLW